MRRATSTSRRSRNGDGLQPRPAGGDCPGGFALTTPYIFPTSGLGATGDMAFDPAGNLDVLDFVNGSVVQLTSANPVNVGNKNNVGATGSPVQFNFEFNAANNPPRVSCRYSGRREPGAHSEHRRDLCQWETHQSRLRRSRPFLTISLTLARKTSPALQPTRGSVLRPSRLGARTGTILASIPVYQTGIARSRNYLSAQSDFDRYRSTSTSGSGNIGVEQDGLCLRQPGRASLFH